MSCTENWVAQKLQKTYTYIAQTDDLDKFVDWVTWPAADYATVQCSIQTPSHLILFISQPSFLVSHHHDITKTVMIVPPTARKVCFPWPFLFIFRLTIDDKSKPLQRPQLSLRLCNPAHIIWRVSKNIVIFWCTLHSLIDIHLL